MTDSSRRLVVLFSHPLVNDAGQALEALDTERERRTLWEALRESRAPVHVCFDIATTEALQNHLLHPDGCAWLHWSGHGAPDALVFENESGKAHAVRGEQLRRLVATGSGGALELAFVSACHSEGMGQALVEAGVKHVVAVELEQPVLDRAAITFARGFYRALAVGRTVREAFGAGRAAVASDPALGLRAAEEMAKFRLLPEAGAHEVVVCGPGASAHPTNETKPPTPHNLPARRPDFVGRAWEVHRIVAALLAGDRLVTVRGAPGIGKTQTSIEAARWLAERQRFGDGICFVDLREAMSAEAMRARIALEFGAEVESDEKLAGLLRDRERLLVLDNLEDPLRSDRAGVRRVLSVMLARAPRVKLLATSRVLIGGGVPAPERVETVPELVFEDSVRLFTECSGERLSAAELAGDEEFRSIFALLGGHPLALSIAASHHGPRSLREIREALEHEPDTVLELADMSEEDEPHLTSVRRSLDLSVRWLEQDAPEAVRLLGMLSLLPGGASKEALDAVVGSGWQAALQVLLRHSLVERDQAGRASLLPVVLRYAERRIPEGDRRRGGAAALNHFADVFATAFQEFGRKDTAVPVGVTAREIPNALACLQRCEQAGEWSTRASQLGSRAATILQRFSRLGEAQLMARLGLKAARATGNRLAQADALFALGHVLAKQDNLTGARERHEEARATYRETGNRLGEANALHALGEVLRAQGDLDGAGKRYEEALAIYQEIGDRRGAATALHTLVYALLHQAELQAAWDRAKEAVAIYQEIDDRLGEANALFTLGDVLLQRADLDGARERYGEALAIYEEIGDQLGEANTYDGLGRLEAAEGDLAEAIANCSRALAIYRKIGDRWSAAHALLYAVGWLDALGRRDEARAAVDEAERLAREIGNESLLARVTKVRRALRSAG